MNTLDPAMYARKRIFMGILLGCLAAMNVMFWIWYQ